MGVSCKNIRDPISLGNRVNGGSNQNSISKYTLYWTRSHVTKCVHLKVLKCRTLTRTPPLLPRLCEESSGRVLPCREAGFPELERLQVLVVRRSHQPRGWKWDHDPLWLGWDEPLGTCNSSAVSSLPSAVRCELRLSSMSFISRL